MTQHRVDLETARGPGTWCLSGFGEPTDPQQREETFIFRLGRALVSPGDRGDCQFLREPS